VRKSLQFLRFFGQVPARFFAVVMVGVTPLTLLVLCSSLKSSVAGAAFDPASNERLLAHVGESLNRAEQNRKLTECVLVAAADLITDPWHAGRPPEPTFLVPESRKPMPMSQRDRKPMSEPGDSRKLQNAEGTNLIAKLVRLLTSMEALWRVRTIVVEVQTVAGNDDTIRVDDLRRLRRELTELQDIVKGTKWVNLSDFDRIEDHAQKLADTLDARICLSDARLAFNSHDYRGCLAKLEEFSWSKIPVANQAVRADVAALAKRADFYYRGEELRGEIARALTTGPQSAWQDTFVKLSSLFSDYKKAPHAEDETLFGSLREEANRFEGKYWLAMTDWNVLPSLGAKVERLHKIVCQHPNAQLNRDVMDKLQEWLTSGIPEMKLPEIDPDQQQAVGKDGAIYMGVFELTGHEYRFWKSKAEKRANPSGYRTILPATLAEPPGPPIPVRFLRTYETHRRILLGELNSERAWGEFERACSGLQTDLDAFEKNGGDSLGVTFKSEVAFSMEVIGIWKEHVAPLLNLPPED